MRKIKKEMRFGDNAVPIENAKKRTADIKQGCYWLANSNL
jgi:hypothetical protein